MAAFSALVFGMTVLLGTLVLVLNFLSGLPPIMVASIFFALIVFGVVCVVAFLKADLSTRRVGPPQLEFRNPARRRRRRPAQAPTPRA